MTLLGLDSAARFSAAAAKNAGYSIGGRYINQSFGANELADYQANGLILLPIYEESGKPGSYSDGQRQGDRARHLLEGLGLSGWGCAFTDDVSNAPLPVCASWTAGMRTTFPWSLGYYGPNFIIDGLFDLGNIDWGWIEGAWSFSSGYNPRNPQPPTARHAVGCQYPSPQPVIGGVICDYNTFEESTPWLPGNSGGDTLSAAEVQAINDHTDQAVAAMQSQIGTWQQEQSQVVINGILNSQRLTDVGWSGREYFYRASDSADVYEILRVPSGRSNPDGTPAYMYGRMHVVTPLAGGDSVKFLDGLSQMGRNPAVNIYDKTNADQAAILAQFEAVPILNP